MTIEDDIRESGSDDVRENDETELAKQRQEKESTETEEAENTGTEETEGKESEAKEEKEDDKDENKDRGNKNRTGKYIKSLQQRLAEASEREQRMQARLEAIEKRVGPDKSTEEPTLEGYDYDFEAFTKAHNKWATKNALEEREQHQQESQGQQEVKKAIATYNDKVASFIEDHPDFVESVEMMPYQLSQAQQLAILRHENGPQIAYHLANHDDDAFQLASVRDELASDAVKRLASRLSAAQPEAPTNTRPTTQAPEPPPKVKGRSTQNEPDPGKMTDDQWYEYNKRKRRAS